MHVVIFVDFHNSSVGGVQTSVRSQRRGLEKLGHRVTIVSPPPVGKEVSDDPATICVPALPLIRPNGFPMVAPTKSNERFIEAQLDRLPSIDIIHVQSNMGLGILGIRIAKKRSVPLVVTMHGRDDVFAETTYPLPTLSTFLLKLVHRHYIPHPLKVARLSDSLAAHYAWQVMINHAQAADHVVTPTHHFMARFREHGLTTAMTAISNGVDDSVLDRLPAAPVYQINQSPLKLLWCGRLSQEKRPIETIEAVSRIPGAVLDLYGDGPLADMLQTYINTHNLGKRIHLRGPVTQEKILEHMQTHDVLVYPSYGFETQGMPILEAAVVGLPVVYCDPALTESVPNGGGILTKGTSIDALQAALMQMQAHPEKRVSMHRAMLAHRAKIVQSYHSKKMVALYGRLIKK